MTIKKYLKITGMSRYQLATKMEAKGWRPSESTLSRWINGERRPAAAAAAILAAATRGEVTV